MFKNMIIANTTKARVACILVPYKSANKPCAKHASVYNGDKNAKSDAIEL